MFCKRENVQIFLLKMLRWNINISSMFEFWPTPFSKFTFTNYFVLLSLLRIDLDFLWINNYHKIYITFFEILKKDESFAIKQKFHRFANKAKNNSEILENLRKLYFTHRSINTSHRREMIDEIENNNLRNNDKRISY